MGGWVGNARPWAKPTVQQGNWAWLQRPQVTWLKSGSDWTEAAGRWHFGHRKSGPQGDDGVGKSPCRGGD